MRGLAKLGLVMGALAVLGAWPEIWMLGIMVVALPVGLALMEGE